MCILRKKQDEEGKDEEERRVRGERGEKEEGDRVYYAGGRYN